jgi:hypothetical protein
VLGREVVPERSDVQQRPVERGANVGEAERADDGRKARNAEALRCKIDLLDGHLTLGFDGRQKILQLLKARAVHVSRVFGAEDVAEVVLQAALDRVVERQWEHAFDRFVFYDAALKTTAALLRG